MILAPLLALVATALPGPASAQRVRLVLTSPDLTETRDSFEGFIAAVAAVTDVGEPIITDNYAADIPVDSLDTIIAAANGGSLDSADFRVLQNALDQGKRVVFFGGSNSYSFWSGLNSLIDVASTTVWSTSKTGTLLSGAQPHPLARSLPGEFALVDAAGYYSIRLTDPHARVAVRNGDGWPLLASKKIGQGAFVVSSLAVNGLADDADIALISLFLQNAVALDAAEASLTARLPTLLVQTLPDDSDARPARYAGLEEALTFVNGTFDVVIAPTSYSNLVLAPYKAVVVAANGGNLDGADFETLSEYVRANNGRVFFSGFSNRYEAYSGIKPLFDHDNRQSWTKTAEPHLRVADARHPLARGLAAEVTFADAPSYALRIADLEASVALRSGDGWPALATKVVGVSGVFVYYAFELTDAAASPELEQILINFYNLRAADLDDKPANTLAILTTVDGTEPSSFWILEQGLVALSIDYDVIATGDYDKLDLSPYDRIIVAMNGGLGSTSDLLALHAYAEGTDSVRLVIVGGSGSSSFVTGMREFFGIVEGGTWEQAGAAYAKFAGDADNALAAGLPDALELSNSNLARCITIVDQAARVAFRDSDGYPVVLGKAVGAKQSSVVYMAAPASDVERFDDFVPLLRNMVQFKASDAIRTPGSTALVFCATSRTPAEYAAFERVVSAAAGHPLGDVFGTCKIGDLDLSVYETIAVSFNGGSVGGADFAALGEFVGAGGRLAFFGGSYSSTFVSYLSEYLMLVRSVPWTDAGEPSFVRQSDNNPLTAGLSASFSLPGSVQYSTLVVDPLAVVPMLSGDGVPALSAAPVGTGHVVLMPYAIPTAEVEGDDWPQLVANMLHAPVPDPEYLCQAAIEIMLVLDGSSSVGDADFEVMLRFAQAVVRSVFIGEGIYDARVGVVQFSTNVRVELPLSGSLEEILLKLSSLRQLGGDTDIAEALEVAGAELARDARPEVPQIVILLSDGEHNQDGDPVAVADGLKAAGKEIFSIAVGAADADMLGNIASPPTESHLFKVEDFDVLADIIPELVGGACTRCFAQLDMVLSLDGSGSMDRDEFELEKSFAVDLVRSLKVTEDNAHAGAVQFSSPGQGRVEAPLSGNEATVIAEIGSMSQIDGNTALDEGILLALDQLESRGRDETPGVIVLMTDGEHNTSGDPVAAGERARAAGYTLAIVAIGDAVDRAQLLAIAGGDEDAVFAADSFEDLKGIVADLVGSVCEEF